MTITVPDPRHTTWERWSGDLARQFSGNYTPPTDERLWRDMAISVMSSSPFNRQGILHPGFFRSWQDWGEALARVNAAGV
jgi:hypothetical protein